MNEKSRIRKILLKKRDSLDPAVKKEKDERVKERLLSVPDFRRAKVIFFFASFRSEVSTFTLIEEALRLGKSVLLPSVDRAKKELRLYEIRTLSEVSSGYMGIPEPDVSEERERDINDAEVVIMPGAAFDAEGNRLGYGGGYYDRLLARLRRKIPLIALAYEEQIAEALPSDAHDIKVSAIVTDRRIISCGRH
ncbi:MAG: 5-formyltetrahydrofolate cyclo-ligase [Nitrospirae bacterium]|nr:5-formyltetrahydrofolate cyclo-ligase [Nitrospirota bacterium]